MASPMSSSSSPHPAVPGSASTGTVSDTSSALSASPSSSLHAPSPSTPVSSPVSMGTARATSTMASNMANMQNTIKTLETRLLQMQSGPPRPEEQARLQDLLNKSKQKLAQLQAAAKASSQTTSQATTPPRSAPQNIPDVKVLDRKRLNELVKEVDPMEQLDEDVEEMLMVIADDFIENVVSGSAQLAKHRKASTIEVKDVQLHLEKNWNMRIPGYSADDRPYRRPAATEAHKQRLALIKKTMKKY